MLTCRYIYLCVSVCVYTCIITYEMTYTFQLLATLLTIYTYGYTHDSICVHTSTHLYTYLSTMYMPMYTYFQNITHHTYIHFSDSEVNDVLKYKNKCTYACVWLICMYRDVYSYVHRKNYEYICMYLRLEEQDHKQCPHWHFSG